MRNAVERIRLNISMTDHRKLAALEIRGESAAGSGVVPSRRRNNPPATEAMP